MSGLPYELHGTKWKIFLINGITNMIGILKEGIKSLAFVKHVTNNSHAMGTIESIMSVLHTPKKGGNLGHLIR